MRIPLIVAARPSDTARYPSIPLRAGKWTFTHNCSDSLLFVNVEGSSTGRIGVEEELVLEEETFVNAVFEKSGSEQSITVYACHTH